MDWQPAGFLRGILHYPACTVCGIFLCADRACDAAPEDAFFKTDIHKGAAMVILPAHPVPWKAEAVL